jgi:hypothetical protein
MSRRSSASRTPEDCTWPARYLGGLGGEPDSRPLALRVSAHADITHGRPGLVIPWEDVSSIEVHGDPASIIDRPWAEGEPVRSYGRAHLVVNRRDRRQAAWEIDGYDPSAIKAAMPDILAQHAIPLAEHWDLVGVHHDDHGNVAANLSDVVGTFWLWPGLQGLSYDIRNDPRRDRLEQILSAPTLVRGGISTPDGGCALTVRKIEPSDPARLPQLMGDLFLCRLRLAEPPATWPGGSCHPIASTEQAT